MSVSKQSTRSRLVRNVAAFAVFWASVGCATGGRGGGLLGIGGSNNKLIDEAKEMRLLASEPQPLPTELTKVTLASYVIEPSDVILVEPVDLNSPLRLPADQTVLPDGTIDLNQFGRINVVGKTLEEIEREIQAIIDAKQRNAGQINVRLITPQTKKFYVLGEVNSPGEYQLTGRETALNGILAAGGLTDRASHKRIIISRPTLPEGCRIVLPICYDNIVQLGDTSTNYQLMPGDRIFVPSQNPCAHLLRMFRKDKECAPCNGPQIPCIVSGHVEDADGGHNGHGKHCAKLVPEAAHSEHN